VLDPTRNQRLPLFLERGHVSLITRAFDKFLHLRCRWGLRIVQVVHCRNSEECANTPIKGARHLYSPKCLEEVFSDLRA
jgi:hypothetical protein